MRRIMLDPKAQRQELLSIVVETFNKLPLLLGLDVAYTFALLVQNLGTKTTREGSELGISDVPLIT